MAADLVSLDRKNYESHTCSIDEKCSLWSELEKKGHLPIFEEFEDLPNKMWRFEAYKRLVRNIFGPLKKGDRVKHPHCIVEEIRRRAPSTEGYTGFKRSLDCNESEDQRKSKKKK